MAEFYKINSKKEAAIKYPVAILGTWALYKGIRWGVKKAFGLSEPDKKVSELKTSKASNG